MRDLKHRIFYFGQTTKQKHLIQSFIQSLTQLISLKISVQMSISTRLIWVFLYRGFFQYYFFAVLIPTPRGERCTTVLMDS